MLDVYTKIKGTAGVKVQEISVAVMEMIKAHVPQEDILLQEPMSKHTTFRIGGEATCFIRISSAEQLAALIPYFKQIEIPYFVLGNGSNLLVGDHGYHGIILQITDKFDEIRVEGTSVKAKAGALLSKVAYAAYENALTGLEFASGIPGTIGGGVMMNAGAYGGEMKQAVKSVTVLSEDGDILTIDGDSMEFGYRTSIIKKRHFTVLEVELNLEKGDKEAVKAQMDDLARKRREKQPLEYPSAGSTFKRPEGYFAGKLIMDAGLRGYTVGGAKVSDKHCGFVINAGKATACDVTDVIAQVQETVKEKFGVTLEREVIYLGDF